MLALYQNNRRVRGNIFPEAVSKHFPGAHMNTELVFSCFVNPQYLPCSKILSISILTKLDKG